MQFVTQSIKWPTKENSKLIRFWGAFVNVCACVVPADYELLIALENVLKNTASGQSEIAFFASDALAKLKKTKERPFYAVRSI